MIFKNKSGDIRSGWKIALTFFMFFLTATIISVLFGMVASIILISKGSTNLSELQEFLSGNLGMFINSIINDGGLIFASIFLWKLLDKKKVSDMGITSINKGRKELFIGLLMGAFSITFVCILLLLFGDVKLVKPISEPNISLSLILGLISFIFVGFGEEIFGRAYIMSVLKQTKNKWVVLFVSSVIFAAMHLMNNSIGLLPMINLFLAGVLLGYMFMKTQNIWMSIGFHITWNYFQGYVCGFQVSGNEVSGIYQIKTTTNNIINGGGFGPEGGLVVTFILLILILAISVYYNNKKIEDFLYDNEGVGIIKYN